MTPQLLENNLAVAANAVELSTRIIMSAAGNDASNMLGGAAITAPFIADAVAARLQASLMTAETR